MTGLLNKKILSSAIVHCFVFLLEQPDFFFSLLCTYVGAMGDFFFFNFTIRCVHVEVFLVLVFFSLSLSNQFLGESS